jgi:hypothetical protein
MAGTAALAVGRGAAEGGAVEAVVVVRGDRRGAAEGGAVEAVVVVRRRGCPAQAGGIQAAIVVRRDGRGGRVGGRPGDGDHGARGHHCGEDEGGPGGLDDRTWVGGACGRGEHRMSPVPSSAECPPI